MTALLRLFSWPLLAKELTEAAARRRTYGLRVVYGGLLFAVFAALIPRWVWRGNYNPLEIMGSGRQMFESLVMLQFIGIGLFLPAMMCGRIAEEKERDSLVLIFLTDLSPWSIVLQKYLGGLVPMLSFLLLAMPLTAVAYAFGGVTPETLGFGLYTLLLGCLQVGALALMCSAWCRTTVAALMSTYLLAVGLYLGPLILVALERIITLRDLGPEPPRIFFLHIPPALYVFGGNERWASMWGVTQGSIWGNLNQWEVMFLSSIPLLISIAFFLLLARFFLVRRAFLPPSSFFLRLFRRLDNTMQRANRVTGHRMLLREGRNLPDDDPIAWREMSRKALGKVHYLVRILVAIELPVIVICAFASLSVSGYNGQCEGLSVIAAIIGTLAVLALAVQAANTIVSERVQQTLEVLLTTPLSAREIVEQKARVLRRFMLVLAIPLLTIFGVECFMEADVRVSSHGVGMALDSTLVYIVSTLLTVGIYLPLVAWLALWIGLKMRTRFKAILTALAVIVAWCVVPIMAIFLIQNMDTFVESRIRDSLSGAVAILSPLAIPAFSENSNLHDFPLFEAWRRGQPGNAWILLAINFAFYGGLVLLFRHLALARADRYLRR